MELKKDTEPQEDKLQVLCRLCGEYVIELGTECPGCGQIMTPIQKEDC